MLLPIPHHALYPNGDGFETAKELRKRDKDAALIFVSSSSDYAIEGYLVDACGYLVKPYTYETFPRVFEMAFKLCKKGKRSVGVKRQY